MKQLPITINLKVKDGKLFIENEKDKYVYKKYVENLKEGTILQVTYEEITDKGSYAQISKVQVCIRELSKFLGYDYEELKKIIKHKADLYDKEDNLKSFADCSKDELSRAIKSVIELGDLVGFPLQ